MSAAAAILLAVASMLGFGFADFAAKSILNRTGVVRTLLISQFVGSLLYLGVTVAYDLAVPDVPTLLLSGFAGFLSAIVMLAFYKALSLGKASLISPLSSCLTVVAVALSILILGERVNWLQALAIVAVILGILLIAVEKPTLKWTGVNLSIMFGLVVIFVAGGNSIVQKIIAASDHYLLGFMLARGFMLGFIALLAPMFGSEMPVLSASRGMYRNMAMLGVIDVSAFFAFFMGLREGSVSIVAPISNSASAVTILLAYLFLNERVMLHQRIGIATIILGVAALAAIS